MLPINWIHIDWRCLWNAHFKKMMMKEEAKEKKRQEKIRFYMSVPAAEAASALLGNYVEFRYDDLCDGRQLQNGSLFMYTCQNLWAFICVSGGRAPISLKHAILYVRLLSLVTKYNWTFFAIYLKRKLCPVFFCISFLRYGLFIIYSLFEKLTTSSKLCCCAKILSSFSCSLRPYIYETCWPPHLIYIPLYL